jgi:hypothetical protein
MIIGHGCKPYIAVGAIKRRWTLCPLVGLIVGLIEARHLEKFIILGGP